MDILDGNLETIETSGFGHGDFSGEVLAEILVDDAIGSSKEGKDMGYEVSFVVL